MFTTVYGPATVLPGTNLRACGDNLLGDTVAEFDITFLNAITGARIGPTQHFSISPGKGACMDAPAGASVQIAAAEQILMVVFSFPSDASFVWREARSPATSVQLFGTEQRMIEFLPAVQIGTAVDFQAGR